MPPPKLRRSESVLRLLGRTDAQPVDALASRVTKSIAPDKKKALRKEVASLRSQAAEAGDDAQRTAMLLEANRLRDKVEGRPNPSISAAAVKRAGKAMESAKWRRSSS